MRAAAAAVLTHEPSKVVVAVPTASKEAVRLVTEIVDSVICLETPSPFLAVGRFYRNFGQTDDGEVRELLAASRGRAQAVSPQSIAQTGDLLTGNEGNTNRRRQDNE